MKVFCAVGILISAVFLADNTVVATQFTVGGSSGWTVPPNNNSVYNQWAGRMRFQVGDSLLFVYASANDSVLQVTKADYNSCNTASPLKKYTDGNTMFKFDHSGPFYFISGNRDNCLKNEKLVVVVMADRSSTKKAGSANPPSSPPISSPTALQAPSSAPVGVVSPPSPPPSPSSSEANPSAAPSTLTPPKNDASSSLVAKGLVGSLGALIGLASFVVVF